MSTTIRETTAKWEYNEQDGSIGTAEVSIEYLSPTIAQLKKQRAEAKARFDADPTAIVWLSEELFPMIHRLGDLPGGVTAPSPMTLEWLDEQDLRNLTSIKDAINSDISLGKSQPAK